MLEVIRSNMKMVPKQLQGLGMMQKGIKLVVIDFRNIYFSFDLTGAII